MEAVKKPRATSFEPRAEELPGGAGGRQTIPELFNSGTSPHPTVATPKRPRLRVFSEFAPFTPST